jgi:hypothetical protein
MMKIKLQCRHAHRLAVESIDRKLSWHEHLRLQIHLKTCRMCSSFGRQIGVLQRSVRQWGDDDDPGRKE